MGREGRSLTVCIGGLGAGGAERVCVTLCNGLAERGWRVHLVVITPEVSHLARELDSRIERDVLRCRRARTSIGRLTSVLRSRPPTNVLAFGYHVGFAAWIALGLAGQRPRRILRCVNNVVSRISERQTTWRDFFVPWLARRVFMHADVVIAQSNGMAESLIRVLRVNPARVRVIPNPLGRGFESVSTDCPEPERILYVGRLTSQKDPELLLSAFRVLRERRSRAQLTVAGDGELSAQLRREAQELGVSDAVRFVGTQSDVVSLYSRACVVVMTSRYEGFPNVLIEALACGRPVVAVDCPTGPRELIVPGENGFLVSERDPEAIAIAIDQALERPWELRRLRMSVEPFETQRVVSKYEELLSNGVRA